jgi:hypothetical protein
MPGNYELYDPAANRLGPVVCKHCWERHGRSNPESLNTVWVSSEGRRLVWWLCDGCAKALRTDGGRSVEFLRISPGVILSPAI